MYVFTLNTMNQLIEKVEEHQKGGDASRAQSSRDFAQEAKGERRG